MKDFQIIVPVGIAEFQALHERGALAVDAGRLTIAAGNRCGGYGEEIDLQLAGKLPAYRLNEEHTVLMLVFVKNAESLREAQSMSLSGRVTLKSSDCAYVIPATAQAKAILESRLDGVVRLEDPIFEDLFVAMRQETQQATSISGADALVEAIVENRDDFTKSPLEAALIDSSHSHSALLLAMSSYTRHKPFPREPISGLRDLGGMLNASGLPEKSDTLGMLGEWLRPRQESAKGFGVVYGDADLNRLMSRVTDSWQLPSSAASLAIFLHWREMTLQAQGVDLNALQDDCKELLTCLDGSVIVDALWLLGYSVGFEALSAGCYERLGSKHPLNPAGRSHTKLSLLKVAPIEDVKYEDAYSSESKVEENGSPEPAPSPPEKVEPKDETAESAKEGEAEQKSRPVSEGESSASDEASVQAKEPKKKAAKKAAKKAPKKAAKKAPKKAVKKTAKKTAKEKPKNKSAAIDQADLFPSADE